MLRRRCHLLGASRLATCSCLLALVWSSQAEYMECAQKSKDGNGGTLSSLSSVMKKAASGMTLRKSEEHMVQRLFFDRCPSTLSGFKTLFCCVLLNNFLGNQYLWLPRGPRPYHEGKDVAASGASSLVSFWTWPAGTSGCLSDLT